LLEFKLKNAAMFRVSLHRSPFRLLRRLDCHGLDGANEFAGERRIDAKPTEHHTPTRAECSITAIASIDGLTRTSSVDDTQATSAPAANQKACEKGAAAATRLRAVPTAVGVGVELFLVPLKLLTVDVTFVVILQQDLTVLKRAMVAVGLARPAVDDLGSVDAFAVGIDASIERVLQRRDDIAVSDQRPIERRHPLAV
jgi:hypothetical protein